MWRLQGAGGRRCELEGSTWEVGSSDGAAPGPMGLNVVIRLGCPRRVRVMVVGTFKPVEMVPGRDLRGGQRSCC